MKDILRQAISDAEKIGRLRKPHYSQGMTHEEAVKAGEELLERTHEKLKNFISVNNCVSGNKVLQKLGFKKRHVVAVCDVCGDMMVCLECTKKMGTPEQIEI